MLVQQIQDMIEPVIRSMGIALWACEVHQQGRYSLLRIYIDRDGKGVSLEDCTQVSREVSAILDVEDPIKSQYQLEVSSPGLDRQLSTAIHFSRYIGCTVKIKFRVPQNNHRQCVARIEKVEGDKIGLVVGSDLLSVTLGDIQKANLMSE